ncbi:MAG: LETM1 domain-containing protein [Bacteroidales bacterium]|jgi:hypothetical protein|nr:LETM1 domain-containing protein [Bacteroidales bacterium]
MDPALKKWLSAFEQELLLSRDTWEAQFHTTIEKTEDIEQFIHTYIHRSGLFYGTCVQHTLYSSPDMETWTGADNFKIAIVEGLILIYALHHKQRARHKALHFFLHDALNRIERFYVLFSISNSLFLKNKDLLLKHHAQYQKLESIIDCRVHNPSMLQKGFWKGSQFNIFTHLDLYFFHYWLQKEYVFEQKDSITQRMIQAMTAASHIGNHENTAERFLVTYFIASGNFPQLVESNLLAQLQNGCSLADIGKEPLLPYALQLLTYEYATLTIISDKNFSLWQEQFLNKLANHLSIKTFDTQHSIMLIQNFVIQHHETILYLNVKNSFDALSKNFTSQIHTFFVKNKVKLMNEVLESKELLELLWKAKNERLTKDERRKVKEQIIDMVKTLPSLAIFMLPGGTFLLPILYKILPEELMLPSSFLANKVE